MELLIAGIVFGIILKWLGIKRVFKIASLILVVSLIYISIDNLPDSDIAKVKKTASNIKCEFISCPGDKDFTGNGSYIKKFSFFSQYLGNGLSHLLKN